MVPRETALHAEAPAKKPIGQLRAEAEDDDDALARLDPGGPDDPDDEPELARAEPKAPKEQKAKERDLAERFGDTDDDEALDRLDQEHELTDDDGQPITKNDAEKKPDAEEDPELIAARDDLRKAGLDDDDLEGLTPAQVIRRAAHERKLQEDFKALKDKLSAAGRGKAADPDDGGPEPDADTPEGEPAAARRTDEPDDLEILTQTFEESLTEEFADSELAAKAANALRGVVRGVSDKYEAKIKAMGATLDGIAEARELDRLEKNLGRSLEEPERAKIISQAREIEVGRRTLAGQSGEPTDGLAFMREAFTKAGRIVTGSGSSSTDRDARANASPRHPGRSSGSSADIDGLNATDVRKMTSDNFDALALQLIESGDRAGAQRLKSLRRA